eukprot:6802628-Alexandrium_andersonii.AAC.1
MRFGELGTAPESSEHLRMAAEGSGQLPKSLGSSEGCRELRSAQESHARRFPESFREPPQSLRRSSGGLRELQTDSRAPAGYSGLPR